MIVHDFLTMYKQVEDLEVVYICATPSEEDLLKELCVKYEIGKYYTDAGEAMKDDNVDACYLGVPNHLHYAFAKQALENGRNVICEKPFMSNYDEAAQIARLAKEKNLIAIEAMNTHYLPNMEKIMNYLPELGDIKLVTINFSSYSSRYDKFKAGMVLPAFDPAKSGGALMDLNIYNINFIVHMFGMPKDVQYFANIHRGIDTSGVLILDYGDFKCISVAAKDCKAPITYSIQGDKKCITLDNPVNLMTGFKVLDTVGVGFTDTDKDIQNYNDPTKHRMYYEFAAFSRMIREKDMEAVDRAMKMTLATMEIQTKARKKAGVVFAADKNNGDDE